MNCDYLFLEVRCSIKLNQIFLQTDNRRAALVYMKTILKLYASLIQFNNNLNTYFLTTGKILGPKHIVIYDQTFILP